MQARHTSQQHTRNVDEFNYSTIEIIRHLACILNWRIAHRLFLFLCVCVFFHITSSLFCPSDFLFTAIDERATLSNSFHWSKIYTSKAALFCIGYVQ